MDPITYSFLLYFAYVLVPMIPAAVIFKMFPDSKVAVSGPLQNLTFKSTGAFSAYIVVVGLGYFLIQNIQHQIEMPQTVIWSVAVPVKFVDDKGKPESKGSEIESVYFEPRIYQWGTDTLYVTIAKGNSQDWPMMHIQAKNFETLKVNLREMDENANLAIDKEKKNARVKNAVTLTRIPNFDKPYPVSAAPLVALPQPAGLRQ